MADLATTSPPAVTSLAPAENVSSLEAVVVIAPAESASSLEAAAQVPAEALTNVPPEVMFSWGGYFQAIAVMLLLLAILWIALHLIRRSGKFPLLSGGANPLRKALSIETQISLGPKKSLVMVRFLNSHVLIGVTEHNITLLKELPIHDDDDDAKDSISAADSHYTTADANAFERALQQSKQDEQNKQAEQNGQDQPETKQDTHNDTSSTPK